MTGAYEDSDPGPSPGAPTDRAPDADPALDVVRLVRPLATETQRYVDAVSCAVGLHRSDVTALGVLADAPRAKRDIGPGDLVEELGLSPAAVSALVRRLERAGHVRRHGHVADRRRIRLQITESATATSRTMFAPLSHRMHRSLKKYTDDELRIAARVLGDLTEAVRDAADDEVPEPPGPVP